MEEINLNYKDEASLESGTGWATGEWGKGEALFFVFFLDFGYSLPFLVFP